MSYHHDRPEEDRTFEVWGWVFVGLLLTFAFIGLLSFAGWLL